jgi:hypothetical protein
VPQPAARPVFLDPPSPTEGDGHATSPYERASARAETVYEQTMLPTAGNLAVKRTDDASESRGQQLMASPVLFGGIAAAVVVIVAAILLIVGVL